MGKHASVVLPEISPRYGLIEPVIRTDESSPEYGLRHGNIKPLRLLKPLSYKRYI